MRIKSRIIAVVACLILTMSPLTALAAGTSSVAISTENPAVGDTFTVTATATESGNMTVKYNENVLSVVNCNVSGYRSSAGEVDFTGKQGTITFKANAAGQSAIAVSSSNASSSSMVVNVGATNTAAPAGASEDFDINGKKYTVSERFSPEEIPGGYSQVQLTINGKSLKGISNGQTTMVYLKPVDNVGGPGTFYVYDPTTNSIKDNFYLGRPDYYVVPGEPSEMISEKLTKSTIDVDGRQVEVYTMQGVEGFVYVYGTSSTNVTGWFQYDVSEKTVQRVNESLLTVGSTNAKTDSEPGILDTLKSINMRYIIAAIIFVVIVVVAIIINIVLKKRDDKADLIDGDEVDEETEGKDNIIEAGIEDELDPKEQKRLLKEQKKREKEERKAAKKEAKRRKKDDLFDEYIDEPTIEDEIQEEFGDFDIDKSIDDLKVDKLPKVEDVIREDTKDDDIDVSPRENKPQLQEEVVEDEGAAFWEDEKDIKKAQKKAKKESKKKKNVFGDEELDLSEELHAKPDKKKNSKPNGSGSDIIDFNDL